MGGSITVNFEFQFAYIEIFYRRLKKRCAHDGVSRYLHQEDFDLVSGFKAWGFIFWWHYWEILKEHESLGMSW